MRLVSEKTTKVLLIEGDGRGRDLSEASAERFARNLVDMQGSGADWFLAYSHRISYDQVEVTFVWEGEQF